MGKAVGPIPATRTKMSSKIFMILIVLFLAAIILAGVFYWLSVQDETRNFNFENNLTQNETATLPKTTEQEITTSTPPFQIKGEISRGNPNKKQIIFTFDGGAGMNSGPKILEIAKKHNVKVTFFVTGKFIEKYPKATKQIALDGHEIFNHTYSHPYLTKISDEQIIEEFAKTEKIINDLTDKSTKPYFRPPYGDRNKHVIDFAASLGYQSVYWTLDALDWMPDKTAEFVKTRIESNLKNGAIILMHTGDDITGQILDEVFTYIENQGYKIVSLTEGIK